MTHIITNIQVYPNAFRDQTGIKAVRSKPNTPFENVGY